jgi:diguanylate cyclase (GGDEF)-like protein
MTPQPNTPADQAKFRCMMIQAVILPAIVLITLATAALDASASGLPSRLSVADWIGLILPNILLAAFMRWQIVSIGRTHGELLTSLDHETRHDPLTGLANRKHVEEKLEQIVTSDRTEDAMCAIVTIDLNDFKPVNDTLGYQAGDAVLRLASSRMRAAIREETLLARTGGDEFRAIVPGADAEGAIDIARRLLDAVFLTITVDDRTLPITASIGVALYPQHGRDPATLIGRADQAMFAAKRARTGWAVYELDPAKEQPGNPGSPM